jgi:peptidyl-prolyl cis-trans isomerase SurA
MIAIFLIIGLLFQSLFAQPAVAADNLDVAAIVNDYPITFYDIEQRMKFVIVTTGIKADAQTSGQLANRILNNLIDEQLQLQSTKKYGINVSDEEIDAAISKIEADNKKPKGSLLKFLAAQQIDEATLREQIASQIAWGRYVQSKIVPKLRLSDSEINRHIEQYMQKQKNVEEAYIATIEIPNLSIIAKQFGDDDAGGLADKLTEQLRSGVNFATLAKQLNLGGESAISANWLPLAQMPPPLANAVRAVKAPAVLDPFKTVNGYQIIFVEKKRLSDYSINAEVLFKEIILHLDNNATQMDVDILMAIAKNVRKNAGTCDKKDVAGATELQELNFEVKYLRTNLSEISAQILPIVLGLQVGETSEPFATPEGIRLLKLCEKVQKDIDKDIEKRINAQLKEEKLRLEAMRELRELRRHAFIDVHG